jgi:hypothetical protein
VTPSASPFLEEGGPDTERMPSTIPGLGLLSTPPAPPRPTLPTLDADDVDGGWPDAERITSVQVPQAHPQLAYAAGVGCRCGAPLAQLVGGEGGVWACAAVLLGVAPGGLHDERVRRIYAPTEMLPPCSLVPR